MRYTTMRTPAVAAAAAAACSVILLAGGCVTNPATGETQLSFISQEQEIALGRQSAMQVRQSIGLVPDEDLQAYVDRVGQRLAATTVKEDLPWSFDVVDDPVVNAFALPGGFIFITRGIMTHFDSEAELAAVLGHEIGHVTARHSAEQLSKAQLAQLGLGLGSVFVEEIAQYGQVLGLGLNLLFLEYSRDDESQADRLGLRYMTRANYEPEEMVDVFEMLARTSEAAGGSPLPTWLSSHPAPTDRAEQIAAILDTLPRATDGVVEREEYLSHIDGLVYGVDPRDGFFVGSAFVHPDLEFGVRFPEGWQTQNTAQAVLAGAPQGDAVIQLTLAEGGSARAAADQFFQQQGLEAGAVEDGDVNGYPAVTATFRARTQQGFVQGRAMWIEYGGNTFQFLGYTTPDRAGAYDEIFLDVFGSFDRLTDPDLLEVEPKRVEIVTLPEAMSLAEFGERYPSTIPLEELAVLNGVQASETLPEGHPVKRVVGEGVPVEAGE